MPIPLNIQYTQAVRQADNFAELKPIEPVIENGEIKAVAGGFAIVFKMYKPDEDKYYALKCFTAPIPHRTERIEAIHQYLSKITSPHFAQFKYLPTELWVNLTPTEGYEYPVVAMEWIEGQTLGEAIRIACERKDRRRLEQLLVQFIDLAMLLLAIPCAHGDLKHDNIIVSNNGYLVLVDYDGMYVPSLAAQEANELGGHDYQHQSRTASTFDRHIDDYSIAIICLSIGALINKPELYARYNHGQNLLLRRRDWQAQALSQSEVLGQLSLANSALLPLIQYLEETDNYRLPRLFVYLLDLREKLEKTPTVFSPNAKDPIANKLEKKRTVFSRNANDPIANQMIKVAVRAFMMGGDDGDDDEKPKHRVTLSSFYMSKYPITQAVWQLVMGDNPSYFKGDNLPVECVSWDDCQEFCTKLSRLTNKTYRLPTEAEWEYAARGGNKSQGYAYAGGNDLDELAWYWGNSNRRTHPVGQKKPNELGLYDMSGNVFEWCQDRYGSYPSSPQTNPQGASSGTSRVLRGGSWNRDADDCTPSCRLNHNPNHRNSLIGLRVVCVL